MGSLGDRRLRVWRSVASFFYNPDRLCKYMLGSNRQHLHTRCTKFPEMCGRLWSYEVRRSTQIDKIRKYEGDDCEINETQRAIITNLSLLITYHAKRTSIIT